MSATTATRLAAYRQRRDHYFAHDPGSPLGPERRDDFGGLAYFPERPDLVIDASVDATGPDAGETVDLQTVDGHAKPFIRAGKIRFEVDGAPVTLSVFKDVERGRYFIPFRDGGAGRETYAGGRYLDPRTRPDGTLIVDFNYAYNPYCAYGAGWSCPMPPTENSISTLIPAGEKAFDRG